MRGVLLSLFSGVYILIAVGALMMLVGFLGCYGAIQESQCLLGTVSIVNNIWTPQFLVLRSHVHVQLSSFVLIITQKKKKTLPEKKQTTVYSLLL